MDQRVSDFVAFVRFALWSLRVSLCDWLPNGHYGWCGIYGSPPGVLDERWWDVFGWRCE
jgi:hypothetical protein